MDELKESIIKKVFNKSWINNGRRVYWDNRIVKFTHFVWNLYNPDDCIVKGDQYKYLIHHKDGNKLNDEISNLQKISHSKHNSLHHKGKIISEETRNKLSIAGFGRTHTNFTKKKMSESKKEWWRKRKIEKTKNKI
jgi:hypothetical protein